jgi:hypothetical protein
MPDWSPVNFGSHCWKGSQASLPDRPSILDSVR